VGVKMVRVIRCPVCKKLIKTNKRIKINGKLYHISCGHRKFSKRKK